MQDDIAYFKLDEVYEYLGIDPKMRDQKSQKRIAAILRSLNAKKKQVRQGNARTWLWTWSPDEVS